MRAPFALALTLVFGVDCNLISALDDPVVAKPLSH